MKQENEQSGGGSPVEAEEAAAKAVPKTAEENTPTSSPSTKPISPTQSELQSRLIIITAKGLVLYDCSKRVEKHRRATGKHDISRWSLVTVKSEPYCPWCAGGRGVGVYRQYYAFSFIFRKSNDLSIKKGG